MASKNIISRAAIKILLEYIQPQNGSKKTWFLKNWPRYDNFKYVGKVMTVSWVVAIDESIIILTLNKKEFK